MIGTSHRFLAIFIATILCFGFIAVAVDPNDHLSVQVLNRVREQQTELHRRFHAIAGNGEYEHVSDYDWHSLPNFKHDAWELAKSTGVVTVGTRQRQVGETLGFFGRPRLPIMGDTIAYFYSIIPAGHPIGQRMGLDNSIASVLWKHHNGYEHVVHVDVIRDRGMPWPVGDLKNIFSFL